MNICAGDARGVSEESRNVEEFISFPLSRTHVKSCNVLETFRPRHRVRNDHTSTTEKRAVSTLSEHGDGRSERRSEQRPRLDGPRGHVDEQLRLGTWDVAHVLLAHRRPDQVSRPVQTHDSSYKDPR